HQRTDGHACDRHDERRPADEGVEAVRERAAHVAAVPACVDDAAEEDPERDEAEAPQLGVPMAPRLGRPLLLDAARNLGTQPALALRARHATLFARLRLPPAPATAIP